MELVQWQMQSIHGLAIHSPESNKSSRWSLMDFVQEQKQLVEFDRFGTVANAKHPWLGCTPS